MQTKTKNSIKKIIENKNFLNNQNYIFNSKNNLYIKKNVLQKFKTTMWNELIQDKLKDINILDYTYKRNLDSFFWLYEWVWNRFIFTKRGGYKFYL